VVIEDIKVEETVNQVKRQLQEEENLSPALRASLELLLALVSVLLNRLTLDSNNSSKPPSTDPNRIKKGRGNRGGNGNKPGGQKGHPGSHLEREEQPDEIKDIKVDRSTLPRDGHFQPVGYEWRQVFDIDISRFVTEYRAEILMDEQGRRVVAPFPDKVTAPVQYGNGVKVNAVYMSNFQLIPYKRIEDHFADQFGLPLSAGTLYNFNVEAYERLAPFEHWLKHKLPQEQVLHADETGINIGGKRRWLHLVSSSSLTYFMPHEKRGTEAIMEMGVLMAFLGTLVHDHWKPYFKLLCIHALCNAHHLRELERAWEQDKQQWAKRMQELLLEINKAVDAAGGVLDTAEAEVFRQRYRQLLQEAESESPPPDESQRKKGQRGRLKRSKTRSLLERLRDFEQETLRFMVVKEVPFTNNQGENDLRMTKVQQKVSGCFRSEMGAKMFCRIRSYLSTCRKHGVSSSEALRLLFQGKWPSFMSEES
jgi:transposase